VSNVFEADVECPGSINLGKVCMEPGTNGPRDQEGWKGWDDEGFQVAFQGRSASQGPVGRGGGMTKEGCVEAD